LLVLPPLVQKAPFDADKQLVPVVNVGTGTQIIAIRRSLPVTTPPKFIAHAKANPGTLNFGIAGANNIAHLASFLLFARAGADLVMVPPLPICRPLRSRFPASSSRRGTASRCRQDAGRHVTAIRAEITALTTVLSDARSHFAP
jgi:hypothetical protein